MNTGMFRWNVGSSNRFQLRIISVATILVCLYFAPLQINAQLVRCATMEQDKINRDLFPERGTLDEFEQLLQRKINDIESRAVFGRTEATVINIPIIVHVVHNGEPIGSGTNLSQEQIIAQIEVLNEDFRRKAGSPGFNNNPLGADIEIEFCLSPVDEDGNVMAEPGIDRIRGTQQSWTRSQIDGSLKPSTIWNSNLFYNIWTLRFGGEDSNLLGYAQFPDQSGLSGIPNSGGPSSTDGVVVQFSSFGSIDKGNFPVMQAPYNRGRTLTHETGHWLGLRHIWGDGPCGNDFVDDTPPQQNESRGCPTNKTSCDGSVPALVQNYMDYSDDNCMNIFTRGQKTRMRAVMELSPRRRSLSETNICSGQATSPPVANFTTDKTECVLLGSQITFTDLSSNFPSSWQWTFQGGDPASSTQQNPRVTFNSPGTYRVTLVAANALGESELKEDFISVAADGLCNAFSNYNDDHTASLLKISNFRPSATGYLSGHNSLGVQAFSELYSNDCGYRFVSGATLRFGKLITTNLDATVSVVVWNARGTQGGPGAVIERKEVLYRQILEDIAADRATSVTFDRETPVFGRPFHVGFEISYERASDTLAIISSADGEGNSASSWLRNSSGNWNTFTTELGANIALEIKGLVGINPSVQVAASSTLIFPGEEVILNARGASIFMWNSSDGSVQRAIGPQLIVRPSVTTTYTTEGSGLELCESEASTTIYVREGPVTSVKDAVETFRAFPSPGTNLLQVEFVDEHRGTAVINLKNTLGQEAAHSVVDKTSDLISEKIDTSSLSPGIYLIELRFSDKSHFLKWLKQ